MRRQAIEGAESQAQMPGPHGGPYL